MNEIITAQDATNFIKNRVGDEVAPKIGIVLGSGLNLLAEQLKETLSIPYGEIPGFSECGVAGHQGSLIFGTLADVPVACLQGRAHYYEGKTPASIQIPIRTLKLLGCESLILTNAAASLRPEVLPGSLVLIEDHINFQFQNPLVGPNDDSIGPRFPSLQNAYDQELITLAKKVATEINVKMTSGIYLATLGPSYETPAEINAFKILGADMVGMSTVPEVIIARHCNLRVLAISSITNMACGMSDEPLTHAGVLNVAKLAASDLSVLLRQLVPRIYLD